MNIFVTSNEFLMEDLPCSRPQATDKNIGQLCILADWLDINPFLHGRRPLLAILSLGQTGKPYSCTMYTEFLLEVLVSRCFV